jgi:cytochrome c oxidase subunit III
MVFAAFTVAFATVRAEAQDWIILPKPPLLPLNTFVLVLSSIALDRSRIALRNRSRTSFNVWWTAAAALGMLFLGGQCEAWLYLRRLGLHLDTIPSSSFFYMLTAAHALHILAGLAALVYVDVQAWRLRLGPAKRTFIDVAAVFWHFLTFVWLYLMALFYIWA